jgi:hypothetical protein
MPEADFESDLKIDEYSLNEEWKNQPALFDKWSKISAQAKREAEIAKDNVEIVKAEIARDIRLSNEVKLTEKAIEQSIILDKRYKIAFREFINKKHDSDVLSGTLRAFDQRKDSLEYLTKLYLSNYYTEESFHSDQRNRLRSANSESTGKEVTERIKLQMKRRRDGD